VELDLGFQRPVDYEGLSERQTSQIEGGVIVRHLAGAQLRGGEQRCQHFVWLVQMGTRK